MISLHRPVIKGEEIKEVTKVLKSSWISSSGSNVKKFEDIIASYTGSKFAVGCVNGTSALHLALIASKVPQKSEVLLPCVSFISTANVVLYHNCSPIFFDVKDNFNIDLDKVIDFLENNTFKKNKKIFNKKTKKQISAIILVHVFGKACNFTKIKKICKKNKIIIIEDAAESLGSFLKKKIHTGTQGDVGCFSFNANKLITTGGGGMLVTQNSKIGKYAKHLSMQAKKNNFYFEHDELGYNYRLPNISATIGISQMVRIKNILVKKQKINDFYEKIFKKDIFFSLVPSDRLNNQWINLLKINTKKKNVLNEILSYLNKNKIEARPVWKLLYKQKQFKKFEKYKIFNAEKIIKNHICLPSGIDLNTKKLLTVVSFIKKFQNNNLLKKK